MIVGLLVAGALLSFAIPAGPRLDEEVIDARQIHAVRDHAANHYPILKKYEISARTTDELAL